MTYIEIPESLSRDDIDIAGGVPTESPDELEAPVIPIPPWLIPAASGLYTWRLVDVLNLPPADAGVDGQPMENGQEATLPPILLRREELRLDIDRQYPQMTASGTSFAVTERYHWVASLAKIGVNHWAGPIWFKDGDVASFGYTNVDIRAVKSPFVNQRSAKVTFTGGGQRSFTRVYRWTSTAFHPVEFEFDHTPDANPVYAIDTHAHPNRPVSLPSENLSIEDVFARAGFSVTKSSGDSVVPVGGAGANGTWSDAEMHDAMQTYWSRFKNAPQWSMWTFWAALHDQGTSLGGIMFDDIGPNHRQGTAIFTEAFIKDPPTGDPAPDAWVARMRFWTAVHEMGHAFNLAHSWQKALGTPWIPLSNEPEARSFMNYPYNVQGGQGAFFADFPFRFSDPELLFMRHAPARFVQMGNADWFDHHGLEQAELNAQSTYHVEVRVNRDRPVFEFLEPVILEVKLTNTDTQPKLLPSTVIDPQDVLVILKQKGKPARQWMPYSRQCRKLDMTVLQPGESMYQALPVFAGLNGWDVSDPGVYQIQVAVDVDGRVVTSAPLQLRIAPPRSWDEEDVAQEFFSEDVGRTLSFTGTAVLTSANEVLRDTVERLPQTRAAIHAAAALAAPLAKDYKLLVIPEAPITTNRVAEAGGIVEQRPARVDDVVELIGNRVPTLEAAETFGHITFRNNVEAINQALATSGAVQPAAAMQKSLGDILGQRGVLPSVVEAVDDKAKALAAVASKGPGKNRRTNGSNGDRQAHKRRNS
ncbi:hypothetical protein ACPCIR_02290 [Mycobacterium sp. NPDC051198]